MNKKEIENGLAEIYMYSCSKCHRLALSQDEVGLIRGTDKYICLNCLYREEIEEIGASGDYLPDLNKIRKLK